MQGLEDGNQVGLPYLTENHNSQYSAKFQRAFESIGAALSNQGSKDIDIKTKFVIIAFIAIEIMVRIQKFFIYFPANRTFQSQNLLMKIL